MNDDNRQLTIDNQDEYTTIGEQHIESVLVGMSKNWTLAKICEALYKHRCLCYNDSIERRR